MRRKKIGTYRDMYGQMTSDETLAYSLTPLDDGEEMSDQAVAWLNARIVDGSARLVYAKEFGWIIVFDEGIIHASYPERN